MNKNSLVSIIIPAYNAASLIGEALDSVTKQTYPNWEVIVIEDGTQDRTENIVKEFAAKANKNNFIYINHQYNRGVSATRNTGINNAKGEYIALLDHDDIWDEYHLEILLRKIELTSADIAFSTARKIDFKMHTIIGQHGPKELEWEKFPSSLLDRCYIPTSSVIMRRKLCEMVGEFDKHLSKAEDLDYWIPGLFHSKETLDGFQPKFAAPLGLSHIGKLI